MDYYILCLLLFGLLTTCGGERVCHEIDGGMECSSRDGNSNSYSRSTTHTSGDGPFRPFEPLPPLPPLPSLFPARRFSLFPSLLPPLPPLQPLIPFRRSLGGHHASSQTVSISSTSK